MLDSILQSKKGVDIDWLHVQRGLNRGLTKFLGVWMRVMVWLPPFVLFGYGAGPDAFRALVVAFLVGVAWLAWLVRAVFCRDGFAWRSSLLFWIGLVLGVAVVAVFASHPMSRFNLFFATGPAAWLGLVGFVLILSQEPAVVANMRTKAAVVLAGLYIIAALYPFVFSLANSQYSAIPAGLSITRYIEHGMGQHGLLGAGLGKGTGGFWSTAELVSPEQASVVPVLPSAYSSMLWEGGVVLAAAFLGFGLIPALYVFFSARRRLRRLGPVSRERVLALSAMRLALCLAAWLAVLAFVPHSFAGMFAAGLLAVLVLERGGVDASGGLDAFGKASTPPPASRPRTWRIQNRVLLGLARLFVIALFGFGMFGAWRAAWTIARPGVFDIAADSAALSGFDNWALARQYRIMAQENVGADGPNIQDITDSYDAALAKLPRNLLLHAEAAQFYRLAAGDSDAAARVALAGLSIDQSYVLLVLERATQLQEQGENEQALSMLLPHVDASADVAYQAASLTLAAGSADRSIAYYESAITQNPNHLQARFELSQALISLNRTTDALQQLQELESRTAEDDAQTREAIQQLRDLVE